MRRSTSSTLFQTHGAILKPTRSSDDSNPYDKRSYLHLLGMLNYLLRSRPDIATALSYAASKSSNPTEQDYEYLLDVVRYLWKTRDHGLIIHPGEVVYQFLSFQISKTLNLVSS